MKASDFVAKHSLRLVQDTDLKIYQDFIKENSMATRVFSLNLARTESLSGSFSEQGIQGFPVFLIDDQKQVCGFFSLGIRQATLNGTPVSYGYLSDLRLSTKKMNRTLVEFRKIYRDILESCAQIEEFKDIRFFVTSVFGDNADALKALSRGRSGVLYKYVEALKTQALWIHPGYLLPANKKYEVIFEELPQEIQLNKNGLSENSEVLLKAASLKVKVVHHDKVVFSALLAKPSLRKLELALNMWDKAQVSLKMNWLLNVDLDPKLSASEYKKCMAALIKKLIATKRIGLGSFLLFKTVTPVPSLFLGAQMVSQIFEVGAAGQNLDTLNDQRINLDSFFL